MTIDEHIKKLSFDIRLLYSDLQPIIENETMADDPRYDELSTGLDEIEETGDKLINLIVRLQKDLED